MDLRDWDMELLESGRNYSDFALLSLLNMVLFSDCLAIDFDSKRLTLFSIGEKSYTSDFIIQE